MTAKIITFSSSKGGCSKTTCCMCVSAELAERGYRTLVIDCDHQATATQWSEAASDTAPFPSTVINLAHFGGKVHREIERQVHNYDFIVIDCPSTLGNPILQAAIFSSDLVLIPTRPSLADVWASQAVKALIERAPKGNDEAQVVFLPTMVTRTSLSNAMLDAMQNLGLPVTRSFLWHRTAYQQAIVAGASLSALGRGAAAAAREVSVLTDEILELVGGKQ